MAPNKTTLNTHSGRSALFTKLLADVYHTATMRTGENIIVSMVKQLGNVAANGICYALQNVHRWIAVDVATERNGSDTHPLRHLAYLKPSALDSLTDVKCHNSVINSIKSLQRYKENTELTLSC